MTLFDVILAALVVDLDVMLAVKANFVDFVILTHTGKGITDDTTNSEKHNSCVFSLCFSYRIL